jgi:hypothetical protein
MAFSNGGVQVVVIENFVAQHHGNWALPMKSLLTIKGLSQSIWTGLLCLLQLNSPVAAITLQLLEARSVLRAGNAEDIANAGSSLEYK